METKERPWLRTPRTRRRPEPGPVVSLIVGFGLIVLGATGVHVLFEALV